MVALLTLYSRVQTILDSNTSILYGSITVQNGLDCISMRVIYFLDCLRHCIQKLDMKISPLTYWCYIFCWEINNVFEKLPETREYDYDNVIMWKPCRLILTIIKLSSPLTWMTSVLWKYLVWVKHNKTPSWSHLGWGRGWSEPSLDRVQIPLSWQSVVVQCQHSECFITGWVFNSKFTNCNEV